MIEIVSSSKQYTQVNFKQDECCPELKIPSKVSGTFSKPLEKILKLLLIFFFWLCHVILVPWLGIELVSPAMGVQSLNHWITREIPIALILVSITSQLPISHFSLLSLPFALHLILRNLGPIEPAGMFSLKSCSPWTPSTQGKGNYIFSPFTSKWLIQLFIQEHEPCTQWG